MDRALLSTGKDDWETPKDFYEKLDDEFHFTLDPCCTHENAKCKKHYTKDDDGLSRDWSGEIVFCNPPYSKNGNQDAWVKKMLHGIVEAEHNGSGTSSSKNRH